MRKLNMLLILSALALLLLAPCPAAAELIPEAAEIPYQINTSDRIVIGTVSGIDVHYDHTIFTITVEEWLYNPLQAETIKVRTEIGSNFWTEDQAEFTLNESVLLMLRDEESDKQLFSVSGGFPGKHPVSDRGAVIEELKVQGKWQEENQIENTETASEQPADSNSPSDTESTPFTGILWVVMAVIGAFVCAGKKK
ncbi:hypothetical protein [Methanosarcina sp. 2.H.A.1B.4]|uniref:hypothetical protein n=1 Tax=Methanosarcina sp. 2.H.A.1B.4 TaxID=1483600 RepID=UPI000621D77C|nr:hypothetical protein [Methanosarcina sp. 2.H.A.1B.4]KKG08696.1 hypothetical protein EO92_12730 [Methanosarcina sp. 2.H.A.1B.4]